MTSQPRITGSLLGDVERPILIRLAGWMPRWVTPDHLTALGVFGAAVTFASYCLCRWDIHFLWLASGGLLLNWFGDSVDGTLARVRRIERPKHGFLVDHTADLGSQCLVGLGAGISPFVQFDLACLGLIVFLAFEVFSLIKTVVTGKLQISYGGIGPTEVRCLIVAVNGVILWHSPPPVIVLWEPMNLIDVFFLGASVLGACLLIGVVVGELRRQSSAKTG